MSLDQWFSTLEAWRPAKEYYKHFSKIDFEKFSPQIRLKLTHFVDS